MNTIETQRMRIKSTCTNADEGDVVWNPVKSLWFTAHALIAIFAIFSPLRAEAVLLSFAFTVITLCLGHTIGLHRLLIHRSFECPRWLEYLLVHLGTVVGMGGPFRTLYMHDIRDWAQRQPSCHRLFIHQNPIWRDYLWQMHGEIRLVHAPRFLIEDRVANDRFYQFLDRTWMWQQLPWAILFYLLGGISFVIWGISVRITVSLFGHWLVGYFTHNGGSRDWHLVGHAIQGYNHPSLSLLTMGEAWHNNHHAFPGSARLGFRATQPDPGWWAICLFRALGLAWNIKLPTDFPDRPERTRL